MKLRSEIAWRLGYDLVRIRKGGSARALVRQLMLASKPTLSFDVGANEWQWARAVLIDDPEASVVSFEPVAEAHRRVAERARRYAHWLVPPRVAIGDRNGSATIDVSGFSQSSSLLPMTNVHTDAAPDTAYVAAEEVPLRRLDSIGRDYVKAGDRIYLKIDTQGFERQVLEGASGLMGDIVALQIELSFRELYTGETLALDMLKLVDGLGFRIFGFCNGMRDPKSKTLLQADGFFIR